MPSTLVATESTIPGRDVPAAADAKLGRQPDCKPAARIEPRRRLVLSRRATAGLVLAATSLVCVAVLLFWWANPVTRETGGPGSVLVELGRSAGMLCAILILVEVTLMARVPVLERRIGTDWLATAHRWLGGYILWLVLVHTVTITIGDAFAVHTSPLHEAAVLVLTYPDVLAGTVGLALLAAVVMTSLRPIRRRLRYEAWQFIHLYVYLAIGLAFAHQFATGALFMHNLTARVVWATAHCGVAFLVLRYRIGDPLWRYLRHRFHVVDVTSEPDGSTSVYVSGRRLDRIPVVAGQYFRWRFLVRGGWSQAHPFSLSAAPNGQWLRMTAKPIGDHTSWIAGCRPGTRVVLEGPYGALSGRLRRGREALLIGAGSGIAPLLAIAEQMVAAGSATVTLVYRVSDAAQVNFGDELDRLRTFDGFRLLTVAGHRGASDDDDPLNSSTLRELINDPADCDAYLCGPPGFTERVIRGLHRAGLRSRRIHMEGFTFA